MKKIMYPLLAVVFLLNACQSKQATESTETTEAENPENVYHFDFPDFEMWTLQDKQSSMSASLFPNVDNEILQKVMPTGEAESAINVFLIHKDGKYVLFDTGLGSESGGQLLSSLSSINLTPADINIICLTHCHRDHIGGLVAHDTAVFPKAEVWLSNQELAASREDEPMRKILNLYGSRVHSFMMGDSLADFIETIDAIGHTPGHTVYKIGQVLIIGDVIHAAALQIPYPEYCAVYDNNAEEAVATRKHIYKMLQDADLYAAGMHLPKSGVMLNFNLMFDTNIKAGESW